MDLRPALPAPAPLGATGRAVVRQARAHARAIDEDFAALYRQHYDDVRRWLVFLGAPEGDCDDIAQEVFLVALRRFEDYDAERSFRAWVFGITRRTLSQALRTRRRRSKRERRAQARAPDSQRVGPEVRVEVLELRAFVEGFVAGLGEEQGLPFVLCEVNEMSTPEAAEVLGVPVATVRARLRLARDKFRRAVAEREAAAGRTLEGARS